LREAAFNYNFQLIGQELNIPVINGSSGRNIPGNPPVIRPADVAAKAGRLSFNGLVYLVPRASEAALAAELESAGFSRQSAGERFSVYVLEPVDPVYDLEIRALEPGERRARPGDVIRVPLLVRNAGNYVWQRIGDTPTQSVYKISKDTEPAKETNGMETDLQGPVFPGGYTLIQARVRAPLEPGAYQVRMMMIRQNKAIYEPLKKGNGYTFRLHVE
jgi:hypothetical protein